MGNSLSSISEEERAILMGSALGDATIQKRGNSARVRIAHSTKQTDYVMWKYNKLKRLCARTQPPKVVIDKKGFSTIEFYLDSSSAMQELHELFYVKQPDGSYKKTITQELINQLPMSNSLLVAWFLDDGSVRDDVYSGKLATQGFTKDECVLLASYLKKWGIEVTIPYHTKESNQYYLGIGVKSFPILISAISNIVTLEIPSMLYKLNQSQKKTP